MKQIYAVVLKYKCGNSFEKNLFKAIFCFLLMAAFMLTSQNADAQIARRGSTTTATKAGGTGTTLTINKPAGVVQGDVMIFTFSGLRTAYPASPGWTVIKQGQYTPDYGNGLADGVAIAFYKVAGAAEPANYTFSVTAGAAAVGAIMAFSGVDITGPTPFDAVQPDLYRIFSNVAQANSITTENADAAVLMLVMSQATRSYSGWTATSPSSLTEILDANVTNSANNDQTSIGGAWALKPLAGATGTGNVNMSGISETYGLLLALKRNPPLHTITSFSPSSGPVGTSVTITGTGFISDLSQYSVYFGAAKATVTAVTATSLTVTVPAGSTYENISVCNTRYNTTAYAAKPFVVTLDDGAIAFNPKIKAYEGFPYGITAADVDGDGLTDLVSPSGGNLLILPNSSSDGNLSFNSPVVLTVGSFPYAVAFKDIDGDDKADLIVANKDADNVSVFKNTSQPGNISFAAKQDFAVGTGPRSIAVSDLDGDGKADIVTANTLANTISVLRNTSQFGVISFATKIDYATGLEPYWVRVGDVDGNGKADIVFANYASSNISVLRNTSTVGALAFAGRVNFVTGSFPRAVALGDIDGDGKLDIAVANYNSNTMSVFRNTSPSGSITMAARADFAASGGPSCVTIGDVDGDGKTDIAVTNEIANTVSVFKNNSTSGVLSIAAPSDFATPAKPEEVVICDINKDGKPDLSVQDIGVGQISVLTQVCNVPAITSVLPIQAAPGSTVTISGSNFSNGGTVSFGGVAMPVTSWSKTSIQATLPANVYGGNIVVTNQCLSKGSFAYTIPPKITSFSPESAPIGTSVTISGINFNTTPSQNIVFFGAVKAVVTAATSTSLTVTVPAAANYQYISATNLAGNVTAYSSKPFIVTLNGAITFKNKVSFATNTGPAPAASADFDGDGKPDLVVGSSNSIVSVLRNTSLNGTVNFDNKVDYTATVAPVDVAVADLDGDGKPDLAAGISSGNNVSLLRNTSSGIGNINFAAKVELPGFSGGGTTGAIAIHDIDGDGKPDIAFTNQALNLLSIYRNTSVPGSLSFDTRIDISGGSASRSIKLSDIDGDGKPDIVLSTDAQTFQVYLNQSQPGSISLAPKVSFVAGSGSSALSIGDIDGDGKPDVAVTNETSNTLSVLTNQSSSGAISFASKVDYPLDNAPRGVTLGDIDGDGKIDVSVTCYNSSMLSIFRNTSTPGSLALTKINLSTDANPKGIVFGDLNGDGKPDLAVANNGANTISIFQQDCVSPTVPTLSASSTSNCGTQNTTLSIASGNLNNATNWQWYSGSCGGTSVGSGTSINVSPVVTTTYYARGEGGCVAPGQCTSITITVSTVTTLYRDADGDGYGNPLITTQACSAPGYVTDNTDCNDNDASVHTPITYYRDFDADGFGDVHNSTNVCSSTPPPGYVTNSLDCDDTRTLYEDLDGDGFGSTIKAPCGVSNNTDCDDDDDLVHGPATFYRDADNDGYGNPFVSTQSCLPLPGYVRNNADCNDADAFVHPGAAEICDGKDNDCNGIIDDGVKTTYYRDADGDGFGNPFVSTQSCTAPSGYVSNNTDCDDSHATVYPGAPEFCDGLDNNCNGVVDEGVKQTFYRDADGDGYGNAAVTTQSCAPPTGYVNNSLDCNDADGSIYPGAVEVCDGKDNDCNGLIDDGVKTTFYLDFDGDGYGDYEMTIQACSVPAGYVANHSDCNDNDASIHTPVTYYKDNDGDGFGNLNNTTSVCSSTPPTGYVANADDCDDTKLLYADNDGDGYGAGSAVACGVANKSDCNDADKTVHTAITYYKDNDRDGFGDINYTTTVCSSIPPTGYVANADDCDDATVLYADNDGDGYGAGSPVACGVADHSDCNDDNPAVHTPITYYKDVDGDGFGDLNNTTLACSSNAPGGYTANGGDCDDRNANIHPGATEVCDGLDNDCDGLIDDADPSTDPSTKTTYYRDADGDGYGNPSIPILLCAPGPGWVMDNRDCNDADASVHPGATEIADNNIDENCDGADLKTWYQDSDRDGYGNNSISTTSNTQPDGYVSNNFDCNDSNAQVHPGAQEVCNGIDDDCDGLIDDADPSTDPATKTTYYRDADGDGYGDPSIPILLCAPGPGWVMDNRDCNDADASIHAGVTYYKDNDGDGFGNLNNTTIACSSVAPSGYVTNSSDCDDTKLLYRDADGDGYGAGSPAACGVANNTDCNDNDASVQSPVQYYVDADHDGYGSSTTAMLCSSTAPFGYSTISGDCSDNSSSVHPGAAEICGNGIDDNCNGSIDENCNVCANATALTTTSVTSTTATLNWVASVNPVQWELQYKTTAPGAKWTDMLLAGSARSVTLSGLKSQQTYSWHIRAKCGTKWTSYSISASFKTTSALSVVAQSLKADRPNLKLYPNPSSGQFIVELRGLGKINRKAEIQLMDINGKTVQKENAELSSGSLQKTIRIAPALSEGIYMIRIVIDDKIYDARLIYSK